MQQVTELLTFDEADEQLAQNDFPLICYERGGKNLAQVWLKNNSTIGIFIGSEGGFEQSEVELCTAKGAAAIGLGKRILRCETAPLAALSIVMNLTGNM